MMKMDGLVALAGFWAQNEYQSIVLIMKTVWQLLGDLGLEMIHKASV